MDLRKPLRALSRRGLALAAAVLVFGLACGSGAAVTLAVAERDAGQAALRLRGATVRGALDATVQRYADTVHDLAATVATAPADRLPATVTAVVGERLPGGHEVLVVAPDFRVVAEHAVDGSTPPPARDLAHEPEAQHAMRAARATGRLAASPAHVLPRDRDLPAAQRQAGVVLAAAVHRPGTGFAGWVLVSVRTADLLDRSLRPAGVAGVSAALTEAGAEDGTPRTLATWTDGPVLPGTPTETFDITLGGAVWRVSVRPTTRLVGFARAYADTVALAGSALASLLLAGFVLAVTGGRDRAVAEAAQLAAARRAETERALRSEAALREREAELVGLANVASDNLHVPLGNIAGFTDLLRDEAGAQLDEASRGFLDRISASTNRMMSVVDELRAYTAASEAALRLEPVDAGLVVAEVIRERFERPDDRPSIDVGELPVVAADADLLYQVFDQIIGNAVRFVRHGSTARVTISAQQELTGWWRIEVADRGIGISADHHTRVLAPFHRAPAAEGYPGSGLGLAICERIISLHGGQIGIEANPGGGTIVWFTIFDGRSESQTGEHPSFSVRLG